MLKHHPSLIREKISEMHGSTREKTMPSRQVPALLAVALGLFLVAAVALVVNRRWIGTPRATETIMATKEISVRSMLCG